MGALVKCPILYYYCVAKAPSCVRLFKFLKSDVWLKSYREICEKQFFLAGALFFVAHSSCMALLIWLYDTCHAAVLHY